MKFRRYAIFAVPPAGSDIERFGAEWLGWDPVAGTERTHPVIDGLPRPVSELTAVPRKYGFHGTLKAPFRLSDAATEDQLLQAFAEYCARTPPAAQRGMQPARLGSFIALVPQGDTAPVRDLAARTVQAFDHFRASLTEAEVQRRRPESLSPRQAELLMQWGYPYVMEEFRFHMTLTGPLPADQAAAVEAALSACLAPVLPRPFPISDVAVLGEADDGRFHQLHREVLSG